MPEKAKQILDRQAEPEALTFRRIFAVQAVIFFAVYGIMLLPRFSTDSYSVFFYTRNGLNGFLEAGRTGNYFLYWILLTLGINPVTFSPVFTAVFILTVSWSAAVLLSLLKPYFSSPAPSRLTLLLLELGVVLAYANIYFAELYFFSDCAPMYICAVFFLTLALILFFRRDRISGTILALVCLCLSLSFYQAFLGFFMIFGSMIILLHRNLSDKQPKDRRAGSLLPDLLRLAAVGGGASVVNVLVLNRLAAAGFVSDRGPVLSVAGVLNSVWQTIGQFFLYYPLGYPSYLTGFPKIVFLLSGPALLCLLVVSFVRNHWKPSVEVTTLLVLYCQVLSVFAPHFVAKSAWLPPRSICSFFAVFTVMAVVTAHNDLQIGKAPWAETAVVLLLLAVNIAGVQGIALDQMESNRLDRAQAEEIVRRIQDYEAESGQSVDIISWRPDSSYTWAHPGIKYTFMDMNIRSAVRSWTLISCISYYDGRLLEPETMPDEIWAEHFSGQEWDSFRPDEQIRFEGNRMYLMVY